MYDGRLAIVLCAFITELGAVEHAIQASRVADSEVRGLGYGTEDVPNDCRYLGEENVYVI